MYPELHGKVVVITGGASGIGLATAKAFLDEGCAVIVSSRSQSKLDEAVSKLSQYGQIEGVNLDAADERKVYEIADYALGRHSRLDVWVNNIGASKPRSNGEEYTEDDILWTEKVCFHSAVLGFQAALRAMKGRGGVVVNISSLASRVGTVGRSTLYGPLKAAVVEITKYQAAEAASHGVRVNCVVPGFTLTEAAKRTISKEDFDLNASRTLLHRMAEPEEIAKPIVFMASDASSYITGASLEVSGGRDIVLNPDYSHKA